MEYFQHRQDIESDELLYKFLAQFQAESQRTYGIDQIIQRVQEELLERTKKWQDPPKEQEAAQIKQKIKQKLLAYFYPKGQNIQQVEEASDKWMISFMPNQSITLKKDLAVQIQRKLDQDVDQKEVINSLVAQFERQQRDWDLRLSKQEKEQKTKQIKSFVNSIYKKKPRQDSIISKITSKMLQKSVLVKKIQLFEQNIIIAKTGLGKTIEEYVEKAQAQRGLVARLIQRIRSRFGDILRPQDIDDLQEEYSVFGDYVDLKATHSITFQKLQRQYQEIEKVLYQTKKLKQFSRQIIICGERISVQSSQIQTIHRNINQLILIFKRNQYQNQDSRRIKDLLDDCKDDIQRLKHLDLKDMTADKLLRMLPNQLNKVIDKDMILQMLEIQSDVPKIIKEVMEPLYLDMSNNIQNCKKEDDSSDISKNDFYSFII